MDKSGGIYMERNIMIYGQTNKVINFAMQQNCVPIIRSLVIENLSSSELTGLHLQITSAPLFTEKWDTAVDTVAPESSIEISPVNLTIKPDFLFTLTERVMANLHVNLVRGQEIIYTRDFSVAVLAYNEWTGLAVMPEMIAAFITPNVNEIGTITAAGLRFMQQWDGSPAYTGYQRQNPNAVLTQMAAVYAALQEKNIAYTVPLASYETMGQKIRLPEETIQQNMGTCLDLSVLYAACLEAVGLHPVLVFEQEHCYAGAWLSDYTFAEPYVDDITALRKRTADGMEQLAFIECTDFVVGKKIDFDESRKNAKNEIDHSCKFTMAVDITRSRGGGVRPLPLRLSSDKIASSQLVERNKNEITDAPERIVQDTSYTTGDSTILTKQRLWERKLLDLSLRNTLLSFRITNTAVQLMSADLPALESSMMQTEEYLLMPSPADWEDTRKDSRLYNIENNRDLITQIAETEFRSKRIRTFLKEEELEKSLKNLQRQAKKSIEENGSNTLYLAMGFMRWYETDISEKARYSPLVLIPIDLIRKAQNKGYSIRVRDEESQVNITLLEMLRQDFHIEIYGLDPLPQDESGVNLRLIFNIFRQAILDKKRWDVEENAFIGLFSFARFIMWNDIRNRSEDLKQNKVVASLMSGKLEWNPGEDTMNDIPDDMEYPLDEEMDPSVTAIPVSADSSQLEAICASGKGQSFVLHGPPGTGKSQTITNMIANALYQGKTVLFVAEKMAALSVVERRLAKLGLDPFCLELHSNKAQKRAVLEQLSKTLDSVKEKEPVEFARTAENLLDQRRDLNNIVRRLHRKREYGMSLREAVSRYENNASYKGKITIPADLAAGMNDVKNLAFKNAIEEFIIAFKECPTEATEALKYVGNQGYDLSLKDDISGKVTTFDENLISLHNEYELLMKMWDVDLKFSYEHIVGMQTIAKIMLTKEPILKGIIKNKNLELQDGYIHTLFDQGERLCQLYTAIVAQFNQGIFSYNLNDAMLRYTQCQTAWSVTKAITENKLVKELRVYAINPESVTKNTLHTTYQTLKDYSELYQTIMNADQTVTEQLIPVYAQVGTDWSKIRLSYDTSVSLRTVMCHLFNDSTVLDKMLLNLDANAIEIEQVRSYESSVEHYIEKERELAEKYNIIFNGMHEEKDLYNSMDHTLHSLLDQIGYLKEWLSLKDAENKMEHLGLKALAQACMEGSLKPEEMFPALEANLCYSLIMLTIKKEPQLASFQGVKFENTLEHFRKLNEEYEKLTKQELIARLSEKLPKTGSAANSSEIGILQKAIKSNGRMMSIRKIFDSIPGLLRRMCPCMLMSPISVAQYIDPSFPHFDLVIFDEASQLPTPEAVGAIARGDNVIVVGDPRQLPPTSFFAANQYDEDNYEMEDMESVLDDCLALNMPQKHLLWHYRSRHESLIAYSNSRYYDNKLYTFPSPSDLRSCVEYVQVKGFYDKGGNRQNKAEAEAVVSEIMRRLRDPKLRTESIGVVTFSIVQQYLIDDLLTEAFSQEPEMEQFNDASQEPVFIKNLENVQGDERDVILFSIGYGPDKNGKVSMNFGPLNNEGGYRRLNVAITRSRKKMMVFATIRPEQIDLSRSASEGVAGLKGFLEFAIQGKNSLIARNGQQKIHQDEFEQKIARDIETLGYQVKCNIGSSEYRIDIGIVHPNYPDEYIVGIMCDGDTYRNAQTARDRNILQPDVLKGLGWNMIHIWSLDYLDHRERVLQKIKDTVEAILHGDASELEKQEVSDNDSSEVQDEKIQTETECQIPEEVSKSRSRRNYYGFTVTQKPGNAEEYYLEKNVDKRCKLIHEIINAEAPISKHTLKRRVMDFWGITRISTKFEETLAQDIVLCKLKQSDSNATCFYWKQTQIPEIFEEYRVPANEENKRTLDNICTEEISAAIHEILNNQIGMSKNDLIKEVAKEFGYARINDVIEVSVIRGILEGRRRGILDLSEDGEKVSVR